MMRSVATLILVATLTDPWAAGQTAADEANEAFRRGEFARAAQLFAAAAEVEGDPARRAEIRVRLAVTYFNMAQRTKAEEALAAALDDQPQIELLPEFYTDDFLALFKRVRARRAAPRPTPTAVEPRAAEPTIAALRQRLALAVDNTALDALLVDVKHLELTTPPPSLAEVLELKSEVLERIGDGERALEERGRAAAIRASAQALPGVPPVPLDALLDARRLLAGGNAVEAAALSRGILLALPSCGPALDVLAEALLEAGRLDDAYGALRTALADKEKPELLLLLGEVEQRRGRLASARDAFRRVAEADPADDRANAALGILAARLGDLATAEAALDRALQASGTLVEARVLRAQIALDKGQAPAALAHLQRAQQVRPDDPWVLGWLGVALLANGNPAAAAEALVRVGEPSPAAFALARAEALRRTGKAAEAVAALRAAGAPAGDASALLEARCLVDLGSDADAGAALEALAARHPDDGRTRYLLGFTYHRRREWRRAAEELTRAAPLAGAPASAADALASTHATLAAQELLDTAPVVPPPPVTK